MTELHNLRNIGSSSSHWLRAVGIWSADELAGVGAVEAFRRAKQAFPDQVTLNLLWALQGALLDIGWNEIPDQMKQELLDELERAD